MFTLMPLTSIVLIESETLRVINYWNELPEDAVNADRDSTDLFKTYLDR